MTRSKYTRLSITLPSELVRWADREARRLGRSRSWVIAEALRQREGGAAAGYGSQGAGHETVVSPDAGTAQEMEAARDRRLRLALSWSPEERFRRARELVELGRGLRPRRQRTQVVGFDTFEEYWTWKKATRASGTTLT